MYIILYRLLQIINFLHYLSIILFYTIYIIKLIIDIN